MRRSRARLSLIPNARQLSNLKRKGVAGFCRPLSKQISFEFLQKSKLALRLKMRLSLPPLCLLTLSLPLRGLRLPRSDGSPPPGTAPAGAALARFGVIRAATRRGPLSRQQNSLKPKLLQSLPAAVCAGKVLTLFYLTPRTDLRGTTGRHAMLSVARAAPGPACMSYRAFFQCLEKNASRFAGEAAQRKLQKSIDLWIHTLFFRAWLCFLYRHPFPGAFSFILLRSVRGPGPRAGPAGHAAFR